MTGMATERSNEDANVAQARLLLASLWEQVEETSRKIEAAESRVDGRHTTAAIKHHRTRIAQLRPELYQAHRMIHRLNLRFPEAARYRPAGTRNPTSNP